MAYSSDITKTLTDQITRFLTLNRHQLAGHVANLDFWVAEVRHCLDVIDGYNRRFEQMKAAQIKYTDQHETIEYWLDDPCCTRTKALPPRRVADSELGGARSRLCEATYRFLVRCFNEGLITETVLRGTCNSLDIGVEASDLRLRT
jgi:hypothetical protein